MRILHLLLAAIFAVTLQFTPAGLGGSLGEAQAATAAEKRRAAKRLMAKRRAANRKAIKQRKARQLAARKRAAKRRKARLAAKRREKKRVVSRRTAAKRKAAKRRVAKRRAVKPKKVVRVASRRVVPSKYRRRSVLLKTKEKPGTIIVDTEKKFLYLVRSGRRAIRYGIGVGREGFGWGGTVRVAAKKEWPSWTPPKEMIEREWKQNKRRVGFQEGGPGNPLGARALYLHKPRGGDTGYRIHGTNEPWSIGLNMSSGCVRMLNKDVEHLYARTRVGSKVVVLGPGGPRRAHRTGLSSLF